MKEEFQFPLVTFALFSYNQEQYVREAVEAALSQDYPNLELIISDDASTDSTWEVIQRAVAGYTGPHQVLLNRNPHNLGISAHVQIIFDRAFGELIVLGAGDDQSTPDRVSVLVKAWLESGKAEAVIYSDVSPVDENSCHIAWQERVYSGPHSLTTMMSGDIRVLGASTAYTKGVARRFPAVESDVVHEDRVLPFRALLLGGDVLYVDSKLVRYRVTGGVSRNIPRTVREYVNSMAGVQARLAKDARQRLNDARFIRATSTCVNACEQALSNHLALQSIAQAPPSRYEVETLRALLAGAAPLEVFKFYLKKRLVSFGLNWGLTS